MSSRRRENRHLVRKAAARTAFYSPPAPLSRTRTMDSTDDLLAELFARPDDEWRGGLDDLCRTHPGQAPELRRRFAHLERCGVASPIAEPGPGTLPERFGPYRLLRRLGDGGMGTVWLALHESLGREVAIKMIRPERLWFENARERFQREVEAIARLRHPGCVQVHQVGEAAGVPYFAMEYVAGANCEQLIGALRARGVPFSRLSGADLAAVLRQGGASVESSSSELFGEPWARVAVRIVLAATEAVAHAHARGIVHRDLKPSNLMVTPEGRVVVIDFGLADAEGSSALTREGSMLGSVPYMAPEQLRGEHSVIGVRTDVRGLGVCLHELLALAPAFAAKDEQRLRADILAGTAANLRERNPLVSRDLAVVVDRAIHVDPEQRYPSALDLAADLVAVLEDRPVQARRDAIAARIRRQMRRRPALTTAIALLVLGVLLVPTVVSFAIAGQRDRAQAAEQQARRREYVANVAAASAALRAGKGEEARLRLDACAPDLRRFEWHHLALALDASFAVIPVTSRAVTAVAVTPAGDRVAAGTSAGAVVMFDLGTGRLVGEFPGGGTAAIEAIGFDPAGTSLFTVDTDQHLRAFDVATGSMRRERARAAIHERVRLAEPVERIVVARGGGRIATIDPSTFAAGADLPLALHDWPADDRFVVRSDEVFAGFTFGVCAWKVTDGALVTELAHPEKMNLLGVSKDRRSIAAADGEVLVLWHQGAAATATPLAGRHPVQVLFPRGGRFVVVPCNDGQILVRDPQTQSWRTLCGHRGAITSAAEVPKTSTFVTGGADGTVRLWSTTAVPNRVDLAGGGWGRGLAVDAGERLYVGTEDSLAAAVDPETGAIAWQARHEHWVNALTVVDGMQTLVASVGSALRFWSTVDGTSRGTLDLPAESRLAMRAVTAPSGHTIAIADRTGYLTLVDVRSREVTFHHRVHQEAIADLAFTASGQVLTAGFDGRIVRTDPGDRSRSELLQEPTAACRAMALAGDVFYTGEHALDATDGLLCERDAATGRLLRSLRTGDATTVLRVLDDERLVAGTESGRVVFWDRTLLVPVFEMPLFAQRVRNLVVGPRGDWIAAIGLGGDPVILHTAPRSTDRSRVHERLRIADLRDRIRSAFQTLPPWRPRVEAALATDPDLDAAARTMGALLLPPTGAWDLGIAAHTEAEPPPSSIDRTPRLRALFVALQEALDAPNNLDLLLRTGRALVAIRIGEPEAALATLASLTIDPAQSPDSDDGQYLPAVLFARGMAHHRLHDGAAARRERDVLAKLVAGTFAKDGRAHLFLRELDDAIAGR